MSLRGGYICRRAVRTAVNAFARMAADGRSSDAHRGPDRRQPVDQEALAGLVKVKRTRFINSPSDHTNLCLTLDSGQESVLHLSQPQEVIRKLWRGQSFASLFVDQHNVADFSSAFSDKHLAVGRPSETKNRLGGKIR